MDISYDSDNAGQSVGLDSVPQDGIDDPSSSRNISPGIARWTAESLRISFLVLTIFDCFAKVVNQRRRNHNIGNSICTKGKFSVRAAMRLRDMR